MLCHSLYVVVGLLTHICAAATTGRVASVTRSNSAASTASSGVPSNATATVNALNATLKWWYPSNVYVPASTIQIEFNTKDISTGWTVYAASETFNVSRAITTTSCKPPTTTITFSYWTYTDEDCSAYPKHVAAQSSAVFVNAFKTPSVTEATSTPLPDLRTVPTPAVATVGPTTISSGTPFVQFSRYEVVSCRSDTCNAATYSLRTPYAFQYTGPNPASASNVDAAITGNLDASFPQYINRTSLAPGTWSAPPTVIVIVDKILVAVAVLAMTFSQEATTLMVPKPTLPSGYTYVPPASSSPLPTAIAPTAHVETTQRFLLLPGSSTEGASQIADQLGSTTAPSVPTTAVLDCPTATVGCNNVGNPVVVGGATITPSLLEMFIVQGQTILPGGNAVVFGDQTVSAEANGMLLWMQGYRTSSMEPPATGTFGFEGVQITASTAAAYIAASQTLLPGGPGMTFGSIAVSVGSGNAGLQIGTATNGADKAVTTTSASNTASQTAASSPSSTSTANAAIESSSIAFLLISMVSSFILLAG